MLDVSTRHLVDADSEYLDRCCRLDDGPNVATTPDGWLLYAPEEIGENAELLPARLRAICAYARRRGCHFVLFESGADIDPALAATIATAPVPAH